jgi:hypothetical protein
MFDQVGWVNTEESTEVGAYYQGGIPSGSGIEERFALKRILYDSQREIKQVFGQTRKVTACSICSGVLIRLPLVIFVIIF